MTYNKPRRSGGVSCCTLCGADKKRHPADKDGPKPRTIRSGCPKGGEHRFATEVVEHGWSSALARKAAA